MSGQNKPGQQTGFSGFGTLATTTAATSSGFTFGTGSSTLGRTVEQSWYLFRHNVIDRSPCLMFEF